MRSVLAGVACFAAVASVTPSPAVAQAYPTKPITLIAPFAAGGTSDTVSRAIGKQMADRLGQPVIVANRTGAGGTIGLSAAAKSAPDGYTIVMGGLGSVVFAAGVYPKLNYDPQADLVPIAAVATVPTVIAVRPTLEVSSLAELIALAKRKPDGLKYGSAGVGGTLHIAGELFERETGTRLVHVPYRGGAPAMTDLLGGQIDLVFADVTLVRPYLESGKVRAIAVASETRSPFLPSVPTTKESGSPNVAMDTWYGLFAPAGTPAPIMQRLREAVAAAMTAPETAAALKTQGLTQWQIPPAEFAKQLQRDFEKWVPLVKEVCKGQCE